jgi:hypothetical protein
VSGWWGADVVTVGGAYIGQTMATSVFQHFTAVTRLAPTAVTSQLAAKPTTMTISM